MEHYPEKLNLRCLNPKCPKKGPSNVFKGGTWDERSGMVKCRGLTRHISRESDRSCHNHYVHIGRFLNPTTTNKNKKIMYDLRSSIIGEETAIGSTQQEDRAAATRFQEQGAVVSSQHATPMRTQEHDSTDNDEDDVSFVPACDDDSISDDQNHDEGPTVLSLPPRKLPPLPKNRVFKTVPNEIPLFAHRLLNGPETPHFQNYMNQRKRKDNFQQEASRKRSSTCMSSQKRIKRTGRDHHHYDLPKGSGKLEEQVDSNTEDDIYSSSSMSVDFQEEEEEEEEEDGEQQEPSSESYEITNHLETEGRTDPEHIRDTRSFPVLRGETRFTDVVDEAVSHHQNNLDEDSESSFPVDGDSEVGVRESFHLNKSLHERLAALKAKQSTDKAKNDLQMLKSRNSLRAEVELLKLSDRYKLPINSFEAIFEWAQTAVKRGHDFNTPFRKRQTVLNELRNEFDIWDEFQQTTIPWHPSGVSVSIRYRLVRDAFYSLMTNREVVGENGENLSFPHPTNIYASQPESRPTIIKELHGGTWWRDTIEEQCAKNSKEILVPVILYMDGIAIDMLGKLKATPLNVTFGILNSATRRRGEAWECIYLHPNEDVITKLHETESSPIDKARNLHNGLRVALKDLLDLEEEGPLKFELPYGGKMNEVHIRFAIAHVIGDTEQHDALCGKYLSRNRGVHCLCRHCDCPTEDIVLPEKVALARPFTKDMLRYETSEDRTKMAEIAKKFRAMSHHNIPNVFHDLNFGARAGTSIHGVSASPHENLHVNQHGLERRGPEGLKALIKYGQFYDANGKPKPASDVKTQAKDTLSSMNALGQYIGLLISRQSDRKFPRTTFSNSLFSDTKKAGHERAGVLLCLLVAMCSDRGRQLLLVDRTLDDRYIENLVLLFEMILAMDEWYKRGEYEWEEIHGKEIPTVNESEDATTSPTIGADRRHGLQSYVNEFISVLRNSLTRGPKGMGNKLIKNHLILHMPQMAQEAGNIAALDSAPSECHHKDKVKRPALLTQRRQPLFESQLTTKMEEIRLLYHAQSILGWTERSAPTQHVLQPKTRTERERCKKKKEPSLDVNNSVNQQSQLNPTYRCGGASFRIQYKYHPPLSGEVSQLQAHMEWESTQNMGRSVHPASVVNTVAAAVIRNTKNNTDGTTARGFTELHIHRGPDMESDHELYRAHPSFRSKTKSPNETWYDFAEFQLAPDLVLPGQILCFVQMNEMAENASYRKIPLLSHRYYVLTILFRNRPSSLRESSSHRGEEYSQLLKHGELRDNIDIFPIELIAGPICVVPNIPERLDYETEEDGSDGADNDEADSMSKYTGTVKSNATKRSKAHSVRRQHTKDRVQPAKGYFVIPNKTEWSFFMTEKILKWNDEAEWTDAGDDVVGSPSNNQEFNEELEYSDDD